MGYYVLGIAKGLGDDVEALSEQMRVRPRARFLSGYLNEIAPAFQEFSDRGEEILTLHSFASIPSNQINLAMAICERLRQSFLKRPKMWRVHLGTIKFPGEAEKPFEPLVVRRRALSMIDRIQHLLDTIRNDGGVVVFGGGAWYVPLCGIKLPPGTVHYS